MFSAITPHYDRLNFLFSASLDRRWRARAACETLRGLDPCRRVLDVATGTGDLAAALAGAASKGQPLSEGVRVLGVDFTRPMLREAVRKYGRAARLFWIEADGLKLPLADGAVDAATIAFGLRNMADKAAALGELARVVRPGGRVAVLEFSRPANPVLRGLYNLYSFTLMPLAGRLISGSNAYRYLAESIREFWAPVELSERMRQAGLDRVRAIRLMGGIVTLHIGTKGA